MKEEYLDLLDEFGVKTGESVSYNKAHENGLIHAAVHVWIINSNREILIQKRNKHARFHPNYWDISAAGHVSKGETSLEAAIKEVGEELGLYFKESDFVHLFRVRESFTSGKYINNEFDDVFIVKADINIGDIKLLDGEVEDVKFLSIEQFSKWVNGEGEKMVPHEEYKMLLDYLETN